ncbi:MAG TPA: DUF3466 family protein [Tepidisphaeraceae bacterium]
MRKVLANRPKPAAEMTALMRIAAAVLVLAYSSAALAVNSDLFVASYDGASLSRFDGATGSPVYANNMGQIIDVAFGPDGNAYVTTFFANTVERVDPSTGAPLGTFASGGGLEVVTGLTFGPDGNLYVASRNTNDVRRFNGITGAFMDVFASGGELSATENLVFGPDGDLYVTEYSGERVLRFDGTSGAYINDFVSSEFGPTNVSGTRALAFGPDGNLYVSGTFSNNVVRFNGTTGAFIDVFATGIEGANGMEFGSDGNLYVAAQNDDAILRFNGTTGALIDTFAVVDGPIGISFGSAVVPEPAGLGLVVFAAGWLVGRRRAGRPTRLAGTTLRNSVRPLIVLLAGLLMSASVSSSSAAFVTIYGGPTYDSTTSTGYANSLLMFDGGYPVGGATAVGWADRYAAGTSLGTRAFRITPGGAVELGNLGTNSSGVTVTQAAGTNAGGTAVGYAVKFSGDTPLGTRAVRWDPSGTTASELGNLGTNTNGFTFSGANAINASGTAAGYANEYNGNISLGARAVRWDASGTATELGHIGTNSNGVTSASAYAINATGTAVGFANKYNGNTSLGSRAVRWGAPGTVATELDGLGDNFGISDSIAYDVNSAGTAVGSAQKWDAGALLGDRPVRWDAGGTAVTELKILGTDPSGAAYGAAYAINDAGFAVGEVDSPIPNGGILPVRWDAAGNVTDLTINSGGFNIGIAFAINNGGTAAGYGQKYVGGAYLPSHALLWRADGQTIDLNSLLNPSDASFWTLEQARGISDTNWVGGIGEFDPDGAGPKPAYLRAFLLDASSAVPEPSAIAGVLVAAIGLLRLRPLRNGHRQISHN